MSTRSEDFFSRQLIDGQWVDSRGGGMIDVINPTTEAFITHTPDGTTADVDAAVAAAVRARSEWVSSSPKVRADLLRGIAALVERHRDQLAADITDDVGTPTRLARSFQIGMPLRTLRTAADLIEQYAFVSEADSGSLIVREPIGTVAAITPWNYPLHQAVAKIAYALAAGNTMVLKPSEVAPLAVWRFGELTREAGLPAGVFNIVGGRGETVGEALVTHPDIGAVAVTGSTRTGARVAGLAAESIKRVSLELGGKGADVMLTDADVEQVAKAAVAGVVLNTGQSCGALTRLVVPRDRLAEVEKAAAAAASRVNIGDPTDPATRMGPLVSAAQRDRVRYFLDNAVRQGARVVVGGSADLEASPSGWFVPLTVLSDVVPGMEVHDEEIFGPVLVLVAYDSEDEAIDLANSTRYGLTGGVWSSDPEKAEAVAMKLRAGQVWINGKGFDPTAPFGGYNHSGVGRENGLAGLEEFLETKVIVR